jgi:hypothetical protein
MKFNKGFAAEISNVAWTRPRIPPKYSADEAEGICLLLLPSTLTTLKLSTTESEFVNTFVC